MHAGAMASSAEAKDLWPIGWHKQSRAENERRTTGVHTLIKKCALVAADVSLCSFAAVAPTTSTTTSTLCSWLSGGEIDADRRTQPPPQPPPPPLLPKCPLIKLISSTSLSSSTAAAAAVQERIIDTAAAAAATVINSLIANFTVVGSHHPKSAAVFPLIVLFFVQNLPQIKPKLGLKIKVQR